jgi:hypothetical protein
MRKWSWLVIVAMGVLSLGAAWAESRTVCPPTCDPATCVPSDCAK